MRVIHSYSVVLAAIVLAACSIPDPHYTEPPDGPPRIDAAPPARYTLTVAFGGSGAGTIASDPPLDCDGNACTGVFDEGATVTLGATATTGSFLGWSGACTGTSGCVVEMSEDRSVGALFGTPGEAIWARQLGSAGDDIGRGIAIDADGSVIAAGEFTGQITVGSTVLTSAGGSDIYVVKLAAGTGEVTWAKRFGGTASDAALAVTVDDAGSVLVAGRFAGTVNFGGGGLVASGSGPNAFALKLEADGTFAWARNIGGSGYDIAASIAARGTSVVVVGVFNQSMTVDSTSLTCAGAFDIFAVSMASGTGATTWAKRFGGNDDDEVTDVALDTDGNTILTGYYAGNVNFGGSTLSSYGDYDVFLLKLDGAGAHLMSQHFGGSAADYGYSLAADSSNNIYLAGSFKGTAAFNCASSLVASVGTYSDAFLARFTQAGACTWSKGFGGTGNYDRNAYAVTTNDADGVAVTGAFCGTISLGGSPLTSAGTCNFQDVFAATFQGDGTHVHSVRAGGTAYEFVRSLAQGPDDRVYVTGGFQGLAEFGGTAFTSAGAYDAFVVALEAL
jgi:hypothetical protein